MDYYIIRIYRAEKDKPEKLTGVVERVGRQDERAFSRYDELWKILNEDAEHSPKKTKRAS